MRLCGSGNMVSILALDKSHEVSVLGEQGNERNVELIVCTAWEESCGVLKVRIRSVIVMQEKSGDSPGIKRKTICQKAETVSII